VQDNPFFLKAFECLTPLGNAASTHQELLKGHRSLKLMPVFGEEGDAVPLSAFNSISATLPPDWLEKVEKLFSALPDRPWGTPAYPIVVTSSNFGIGHMLAYHQTQNLEHLRFAQAHCSMDRISERLNWGPTKTIISHACVSADLGIQQAGKMLENGLAKEVLVFTYDFLSPFVSGGFNCLKILNGAFPSPFADQEIGSIGLGDGLAYAVFSKEEDRFEFNHTVSFNELYFMTANMADGSGFNTVLNQLKTKVGDKHVWVKGHGTGTRDAGKLECDAIFAHYPEAPLVSWKGGIGHTLGSCGLVELGITLEGLKHGKIPGTVGTKAPTLSPNVAIDAFEAAPFDGVIMSSNAFGGAHASYFLKDHQRSA
jgi:hypothetical protein